MKLRYIKGWIINIKFLLQTSCMAIFSGTMFATLTVSAPGLAQIVPDSTLGTESSVVTSVDAQTDRIDGGALRDSALFHSFDQFGILEGRGAYFANPDEVNVIFSRVTGETPSDIFGTLGVLGEADLVFLNPNGILFGPNAELDLRGSFAATTANTVELAGGETFSVLQPDIPSLLNVNVEAPIGLRFGSIEQGLISSEANLSVEDDLTLAANNLNLQGQIFSEDDLTLQGQDTVTIRDSENNPFIAAAGNQLTVQGNQSVDIFVLNHSDSGLFSGGDMVLRSAESVSGDAHYWSGGSFHIEQLDHSLGRLISLYDPILKALGDVYIQAYEGTSLHIMAGGRVDIPDYVWIQGSDTSDGLQESILLSNGEMVFIDGKGEPTLDIRAGVDQTFISPPIGLTGNGRFLPPSFIEAEPTSADINVGTITFRDSSLNSRLSGRLYLSNNFQPNSSLGGDINITSTSGFGAIENGEILGGGDVILDSRQDILIQGNVDISTVPIFGFYIGEGGNLTLLAGRDITLPPGSSIISEGSLGGDFLIESGGDIFVDGGEFASGSIVSASYAGAFDDKGGNIRVNSRSLSLKNGAQIISVTLGSAESGNVTVDVDNTALLEGVGIDASPSGIFNQSFPLSEGSSGQVMIDADNLFVIDGAQVTANTFGFGNAGSIVVNTRENVRIDGQGIANNSLVTSGLYASADSLDSGSGGTITVSANNVTVTNSARLNAITQGGAPDPNDRGIDISASSVLINNEAVVSTSARGESQAGNISILTDELRVSNGGELDSSTFGSGAAGNILVDAEKSVSFDGMGNSGFPSIASTSSNSRTAGQGGNIKILAPVLDVTNGAQLISSTIGRSRAGDIILYIDDTVTFDGTGNIGFASGAFSQVFLGASGNGGQIDIEANSLFVLNGAQIGTSTIGSGDAGNIAIDASNSVVFDGAGPDDFPVFSGALSNVLIDFAEGDGGDIEIQTNSLSVTNEASILADTRGRGDSGDIFIRDAKLVNLLEGSISTAVDIIGIGEGGVIDIDTEFLAMADNSIISSEAQGLGAAGNILINSRDRISLNTDSIISTNASNQGVKAGTIDIVSSNVSLDNRSRIIAGTESGDGGNIIFRDLDSLILRRGQGIGGISTTAGTEESGGDGGNITFNGGFIFAVPQENSDITANAFSGSGGQVFINARQLSGIEFRPSLTPFSDITASSEEGPQGTVTIDILDVDPTQGLATLPQEPRAPEIIQGCRVSGNREATQFFDAGRGGTRPNPDDLIVLDTANVDWVSLDLAGTPAVDTSESNLEVTDERSTEQLLAVCQGGQR